jgi:YHS domain-containing protein
MIMNRRALLKITIQTTAVLAVTNWALAKEAPVYTGILEGVGAGGYDVVSYTKGTPQKGDAKFTTDYEGAKWYFTSAENLKTFAAAPDKYLPAYGGYCAYAIAKGSTAKGDPEVWSIVDGKLYLNYNASIQSSWKKDTAGYITSANANWPKVLE